VDELKDVTVIFRCKVSCIVLGFKIFTSGIGTLAKVAWE